MIWPNFNKGRKRKNKINETDKTHILSMTLHHQLSRELHQKQNNKKKQITTYNIQNSKIYLNDTNPQTIFDGIYNTSICCPLVGATWPKSGLNILVFGICVSALAISFVFISPKSIDGIVIDAP